jgi:hypothetical protein
LKVESLLENSISYGILIIICKYHLLLKGTRELWRNSWFGGLGQKLNKLNLENFIIPEIKEVIKIIRAVSK